MTACLWNEQAHRFDEMDNENMNPIIAIKGSRITDYMGKQLNVGEDTFMVIDYES